MLASVVVLADVIYYYKGVITARVSTPPIVFHNGTFTYKTPTGTCNFTLNSYFNGYVNFTALPTGFTATIQLTNASYAYFYHALGLVVNKQGLLYVTKVKASGSIIKTLTIIVKSASTGESESCSFTVISNSQPITSPTTCNLSPGPYFISVLVQPNTPLYTSQSENVTIYFGYNVVSNVTVPLPPISG